MKAAQPIFPRILNVRYRCSELDSEFVITGVSGNQAQAQFSFWGMVIPVIVYHHPGYLAAPGPVNFWFAGADIDPKEFVGGTGSYVVPEGQALPARLQLGGAYPSGLVIATFTGTYLCID